MRPFYLSLFSSTTRHMVRKGRGKVGSFVFYGVTDRRWPQKQQFRSAYPLKICFYNHMKRMMGDAKGWWEMMGGRVWVYMGWGHRRGGGSSQGVWGNEKIVFRFLDRGDDGSVWLWLEWVGGGFEGEIYFFFVFVIGDDGCMEWGAPKGVGKNLLWF